MKALQLMPLALLVVLGCNYVPNRTVVVNTGDSADAAYMAVLSVLKYREYREIAVDEEHRCVRTAAKVDGKEHFYAGFVRPDPKKVSVLELCVSGNGVVEVHASGHHVKTWAGKSSMHRKLREEIDLLLDGVRRTTEALASAREQLDASAARQRPADAPRRRPPP
jgi:hypothetical protein